LKGSIKAGPRAAFFRQGTGSIPVYSFDCADHWDTRRFKTDPLYSNEESGLRQRQCDQYSPAGNLLNKYSTFQAGGGKYSGRQSCYTHHASPHKTYERNVRCRLGKIKIRMRRIYSFGLLWEYDFVKTLDLQLLQGRDFSKDYPTDSSGYLLNESALRVINYKDPVGKQFTFWGKQGTIIGVVKDFHFNSLHDPIQPLILRMREDEISRKCSCTN
jgi:hypothetical protein